MLSKIITLSLLSLLILAPQSKANENSQSTKIPGPITYYVKVTATVPVSNLWEKTIKENALAHLESVQSVGEPTNFSLIIRGLQNEVMLNQRVSAYIQSNKMQKIIKSQSDSEGRLHFQFIPEKRGNYTVTFINQTYDFDKVIPLDANLQFLVQ